jgi:hypothetical protein
MHCPYCNQRFGMFLGPTPPPELPAEAPVLCEGCNQVSMLIGGKDIRKTTAEELEAIKQSPVWDFIIGPAQDVIARFKKARSAQNN